MSRRSLPTFSEKRLVALTAVVSTGLWILFYNIGPENLGHFIVILGWFILIPMILVLGQRFPLVASEAEAKANAAGKHDPAIEALRKSYAHGVIDDDEFEKRLERLLETQDIAWQYERFTEQVPKTAATTTSTDGSELESDGRVVATE